VPKSSKIYFIILLYPIRSVPETIVIPTFTILTKNPQKMAATPHPHPIPQRKFSKFSKNQGSVVLL
jgi:hypothetical protein